MRFEWTITERGWRIIRVGRLLFTNGPYSWSVSYDRPTAKPAPVDTHDRWYCSCGWSGAEYQPHIATTGHAVRNFALTATDVTHDSDPANTGCNQPTEER